MLYSNDDVLGTILLLQPPGRGILIGPLPDIQPIVVDFEQFYRKGNGEVTIPFQHSSWCKNMKSLKEEEINYVA